MDHLLVTVGGSSAPIVRTLRTLRARHVIFFCSSGPRGSVTQVQGDGLVCEDVNRQLSLRNIPTQAELPAGTFDVCLIKDPDQLQECYRAALHAIRDLQAEHPHSRIAVDYSGGTKSMSAGLLTAAIEAGLSDIYMVTGVRRDLRQVTDGTELVQKVNLQVVFHHRAAAHANDLASRWDYAGAERILTSMSVQGAGLDDSITRAVAACRAFDAWDRFEYRDALHLLKQTRGFDDHKGCLGRLAQTTDIGSPTRAAACLHVADLISNAGRRADRGRYDDAVARIYRAIEQIAQARLLFRHDINTEAVSRSALTEELDARHPGKGPATLGLLSAWELLLAREADSRIGRHYAEHRDRLVDGLKIRNLSCLAHGSTPVSARQFHEMMESGMGRFAWECAEFLLEEERLPRIPEWPRALLS